MVNDAAIPGQDVVAFVERWTPVVERIGATFFEATTAMAFAHFRDQQVDVAVIETGLGGRLDTTNVVDPVVAGVTSIGIDHIEYLGDTLEEIASEKAGIFKSGRPAVIGEPDAHIREFLAATRAGRRRIRSPRGRRTDAGGRADGGRARHRVRPHGARRPASPADAAHGRAPGRQSGVRPRVARRRRAAVRGLARRRRIAARGDSNSRAFPARGQVPLRRRAQPATARMCSRGRLRASSRRPPVVALVCVLGDKDWREMLDALAPHVARFVLTNAPTAPGEPGVGPGGSRGVRHGARMGARGGAGLRRRPGARRGGGGDGARHRIVPHGGRCDVALAGISARPVGLGMAKGALPGFRDFYPRGVRRARVHHEGVARCGAPVRVRRVRRTAARAARPVHEEERRRDRRAALQLHGQGRTRGVAAARDDADVRAHGGREGQRPAQAGALVLGAAAVPLRAPAEGAAARALPAQRGHRRRGGRDRRRRTARGRHRDHARARAHAERRAGPRVRPAPVAGVAGDARRRRRPSTRRVRGDRQDRAPAARRLAREAGRARPGQRGDRPRSSA